MIGDRRRHLLERGLLARVGVVWAVVAAMLTLTQVANIAAWRFPDGDDILRLLQVRDMLAGQSWFDVTQYRVVPPEGVAMHWSRIVDLPLALVIVVLSPFFGMGGAEHVAVVLVPLVTLFAVLLLIGWMAWRLFDEEVTGLACLVAAMSPSLLHQLRPMRIDHHGWQIVCGLLAVAALMSRDARKGGWIAGAALATWLAISMEALPMVVGVLLVLLARWLRCWTERVWMISAMQSLAVTSLGLYLVTRGLPVGHSYCDAMSPALLAAMGVAAIGMTGFTWSGHRPFAFVLGCLAALGVAALGTLLALAPQCAAGSFAEIDPYARDVWLANVTEGLPLWDSPVDVALRKIVPLVIAIVVSLNLAGRTGGWLRRWHLEYTFLLVIALAIACFVSRAATFAVALAAVPIGWQLKVWLRSVRNLHKPGRQAAAFAGIVAALMPAAPLSLLMLATPSRAAPAPPAAGQCDIEAALATLNTAGPATFLAPIDLGGRILLASEHRVLATAHHRASGAIADDMRAFILPEATAHRIVERRRIDYIVACDGFNETEIYRDMGRGGLADQLLGGKAPAWLAPVPTGQADVHVWRVIG